MTGEHISDEFGYDYDEIAEDDDDRGNKTEDTNEDMTE